MIDAEVEGDAGAHGELALDGAAGRRGEVLGEERCANLLVAVGAAGGPDQRAVLFPGAEFPWRDEAALPEARLGIPGAQRVGRESGAGAARNAQGKALAQHLLVQAHRLSLDAANAKMPLFGGLVRTEIVAMHGTVRDQLAQLVARLDAAGPG